MSLRKQLLAFGVLTLALPWAGYRFVQEMEATLRSGLEQALLASAGTVAAALDGQPLLLEAAGADGAGARAPQPSPSTARAIGAAAAETAATTAAPEAAATEPPATAAREAEALGAQAPTREAPTREALGAQAAATVYAVPLEVAPRVDGALPDDWSNADDAGVPLGGHSRYWAGIHGRYLYLYVAAVDPDIVYEGPPGAPPYGDRLVLALDPVPGGAVRWLVLATRAPGTFRAQLTAPPLFKPGGSYEDRVLAAWQETQDGYAVEARVPLELVGGRLGLALVDVDSGPSGYAVSVSSTWPLDTLRPGPMIYQHRGLRQLVAEFAERGSRFRVLNREGWVLADMGSIAPAEPASAPASLADRLFRSMLRRDDPPYERLEARPGRVRGPPLDAALAGRRAAAWYGLGPGNSTVVAAAVPIRSAGRVLGAVLLEQASDPILTLTDRALVRLMSFTLLATSVAAVGLLGFATLLSFRVRRLARAAETALGPKGEIDVTLPGRGARDELGDLARSFGRLLERLREHTEYLRTLASKLSHELRTPLAVVSTSLDNLEQEVSAQAAVPYLKRLRHGAARLDAILAAMAEATRMEQAIGDSLPERFQLAAVVQSCSKAYSDIYPERRFECRVVAGVEAIGSAELTAQLIDKLVDNAVDFSPAGSLIEIDLAEAGPDWRLRVSNRGPLLPEAMRGRLFDSLVSVRGRDDGRPHLGLGLHIVALIAEFHGGRAEAENLPDGGGVAFSVRYPRPPGSPG